MSVGNAELEKRIKDINGIEIVDSENDLNALINLLPFMVTDYLIINSLLDSNGKKLNEIACIAKKEV